MKLLLAIAFCFSACTGEARTVVDATGRVRGHVVSSIGLPVEGAMVSFLDGHGSIGGPLFAVLTDRKGEFLSSPLQPGSYNVIAWKEADGVPSPLFAINEPIDSKPIQVIVTANGETKDTILALPPPFGRLTLSVVDESTSKPISSARLQLQRPSDLQPALRRGFHQEGRVSMLLPERPIQVMIYAPGYAAWTYVGPSGEEYLVLKSGEKKQLEVRLVPVKPL